MWQNIFINKIMNLRHFLIIGKNIVIIKQTGKTIWFRDFIVIEKRMLLSKGWQPIVGWCLEPYGLSWQQNNTFQWDFCNDEKSMQHTLFVTRFWQNMIYFWHYKIPEGFSDLLSILYIFISISVIFTFAGCKVQAFLNQPWHNSDRMEYGIKLVLKLHVCTYLQF